MVVMTAIRIITMAKSRLRVLRKYPGEQLSEPLLDWLNRRKRTADHRRIERLLRNLFILRQGHGEGDWSNSWGARHPRLRGLTWPVVPSMMGKELRRVLRAARKELARHRMWPDVESVSDPVSRSAGSKVDFIWNTSRKPAADAVLQIVLLGREGLLWRVRQCPGCQRWFFARFSHQNYCGMRCQQGHYKRSPEWREHRRKYMQKYRQLTS
jgi:hypothetical protein